MSSKRRQAASRANGKKSKGPVTPEGKARSAANSTKHGLASAAHTIPPDPNTAGAVCLRIESKAAFLAFHRSLVDELQPTTPTEAMLVEELAMLRWRKNRAQYIETALFDNEMDTMAKEVEKDYETMDDATRTALAFRSLAETSPSLALLHRYEFRLARQIDRCSSRLDALRQNKREGEMPNDPNPKNEHSNEEANQQHDSQLRPRAGDALVPTPAATPVPAAQPGGPAQDPPRQPSELPGLPPENRSPDHDDLSGLPRTLLPAA